ncbi:MAG: ArsR/SmtB family transcription factor [Candidatus Baldrarchaeia archaeon]
MDIDDYMRYMEELLERLRVLMTQNCIRILQMLEEPKYWTQLVEELNMHRWLVKRYLDKLLEVGLVESFVKPSERGPPRRYYRLAKELAILFIISSNGVFIREIPLSSNEVAIQEVLKKYPSVRRILEIGQEIPHEEIEKEINSLTLAIRLLLSLRRSKR